jgi:hypothetical protein
VVAASAKAGAPAGNAEANTNGNPAGGGNSTVLNTGKLSFDCLLNCLDGVEKSNGIFTVITTNHIEKLDPAMGQPRRKEDGSLEFISTRPGRIDKAIELGYMADADKLKLARRIFFDNEAGYRQVCRLLELEPHRKETPAQFQERCAQIALEMLWQSEHPETAVGDTGEAGRPKEPFGLSPPVNRLGRSEYEPAQRA